MEKVQLILTIITGVFSLGLIAVLRNIIKEVQEARDKWEEINADGERTEKELLSFAKEVMDVINEAIKFWGIIKKLIGMKKK